MPEPTTRFRRNEKLLLMALGSFVIGGMVTAGSIFGIQSEIALQKEPHPAWDPNHPCATCYEDCINDYP